MKEFYIDVISVDFKTLKTLKNLIIIKKIEIQPAFHC